MQVDLHGEVKKAILSRLESGRFRSAEEVIADAILKQSAQEKTAMDRFLKTIDAVPKDELPPPQMNGIDRTLYSDPYS